MVPRPRRPTISAPAAWLRDSRRVSPLSSCPSSTTGILTFLETSPGMKVTRPTRGVKSAPGVAVPASVWYCTVICLVAGRSRVTGKSSCPSDSWPTASPTDTWASPRWLRRRWARLLLSVVIYPPSVS